MPTKTVSPTRSTTARRFPISTRKISTTISSVTPAISSAGHYAKIVQETALLRQLIFAAGDIAEIAYSEPDDVVKALDMAETKVFNVAEARVTDSTRMIEELLPEVMDRLQETYDRGDIITGVPTGYTDLDELLSGLQPSALYIVGARPAMGLDPAGQHPQSVALHAGDLPGNRPRGQVVQDIVGR